jgi:Domain of unknown function (DUF4216)
MPSVGRLTRSQTLEKLRQKEFADWLHKKVLVEREFDIHIRKVGFKPLKQATFYNGYDVNGFRFHTEAFSQDKSTINSGVCVKGESSNNIQQDYYGILQEVIELEYHGVGHKLVLFKCRWFNPSNEIRVDQQHGIIEVKHTSILRGNDNFVLACQATQVYYLPYVSEGRERRQWWIAMKTRRKDKFDSNHEFYQEEQSDFPILVSTELDNYENGSLELAENSAEHATSTLPQLGPHTDLVYDSHEDQGQTDEDNYSNETDGSLASTSEGSDEEQW